jgi:quinol-cytochrome oxidoreductase complex cytochrome b subunit
MPGTLFFSILFFSSTNCNCIFLAMFYNPSASLAYASIMHINNEVYMVDGLELYMLMEHLDFF